MHSGLHVVSMDQEFRFREFVLRMALAMCAEGECLDAEVGGGGGVMVPLGGQRERFIDEMARLWGQMAWGHVPR